MRTTRLSVLGLSALCLPVLLAFILALAPASAVLAQDTPPAQEAEAEEQSEDEAGEDDDAQENGKIKPYDEVITEEAETREGVFKTHRIEDKLFYEIPESEMGSEFVWVTQIARTQTSYGYGGLQAQNRVVRWDKHDDSILLRNVEYNLRAEDGTPEAIAVEASSVPAIIKKFDVVAYAEDGAAVIEVTGLFMDDVPEFSPKVQLRDVQRMDKSRSFFSSVKAFPLNIETRVLATFAKSPSNPFQQSQGRIPAPRRSDPSLGSVTIELHHSMVKLPEDPMLARNWDARVGFFSVGHEDYSSDEHEVENRRYITRWRLEKKNPDAAISDPVKPIVYYIGRGIPEKWRSYIAQGVEDWQEAFEAAGFSNAIVARDAPSAEEDPDWDAEDARHSTIRWLPSTIQNAFGPHIHDPRTGEILEADVRFYHNVIQLARNWYFVQVSPMDARAQDLPLPDDLMGELVRYIAAHEVGHTLGYPHNMKASSCYTVAQLRSAEFTAANGNEASIMDYGRFNYVAQPGDGARLIPRIGPYDRFVTEWGYTPVDGAMSPDDEKSFLGSVAARQLDDACLRFGSPGIDPLAQTEDLSADAIEATRLGLLNLERVASFVVAATGEEGEDYSLLSTMHTNIMGQRDRELGHVAALVGGVEINRKVYGQSADVYTPLSRDRQAAAVAFLLENGFKVQPWLVADDVLMRVGMTSMVGRFTVSQDRLLRTLYNPGRVARMVGVEATTGNPYTIAEMTGDLAIGLFEELGSDNPDIDPYRRAVQRSFVTTLIGHVTNADSPGELRAVARGALSDLQYELESGARRAGEVATRYHLADLVQTITAALAADYVIER
jgi:hypothetical protein